MKPSLGSLFSGAGGFEMGFEAAGFRTAWQCEIDNDATDVLERHWPDVRRFRDVREIDPADLEPVDVVTGGFPCQPFSVAGNRQGQDDERYLFPEILRIVRGMREATDGRYPAIVVLENVPGLLNSDVSRDNPGGDFAHVLAGLSELGAAVAYRILDAQFFGVPQRRRRVFIVADFAEPSVGERRAAQILSLFESVRGDSPESGEARQSATGDAEGGAGGGGVAFGLELAHQGAGGNVGWHGVERPFRTLDTGGPPGIAIAVDGQSGSTGALVGTQCSDQGTAGGFMVMSGEAVRDCLTAHGGSHGRIDAESETFVVASAITASAGHHGHSSPRGDGSDNLVAAFDERQITSKANRSTVQRGTGSATLNGGTGMSVIEANADRGVTHCLTASHGATEDGAGRGTPLAASHAGMSVRRLTPRECERLMGWPDDHTRYRADGREIPDGPRYRLCGNGVVAPVAEWLAHRVAAILQEAV